MKKIILGVKREGLYGKRECMSCEKESVFYGR